MLRYGYRGAKLASLLATKGFKVQGVDNSRDIVTGIQRPRPPLNQRQPDYFGIPSPAGTTEAIADWLRELRPDLVIPSWETCVPSASGIDGQIFLAHSCRGRSSKS